MVLILSFVLSIFSGCKAEGDKNHYSVLQWLDKVEETFNLLYYTETEPYVKSMSNTDSGFDTVQIAAEWGIINPEDEIDFNGRLTKEFAADTLVRAMNCVTPATVDISDSKKVNPLYLENVMSSVNEGLFEVKSGKFQPKKKLTIAQADGALEAAHYKWVNFSYGESFDRSIVKENVINFGGVTSENCPVTEGDYKVEYSGSREFFDEFGGYTDNTQKTITFSAGKAPEGLAVDSVLAMPADDVVPMNYAVVVTGITNNSDGSVTVSTRKAELSDVYEEIDIQQSGPLDFSNAVFYGPDGQRLTFSNDNAAPMGNINSDALTEPLGLYRPGELDTLKTSTKTVTVDLGDGFKVKFKLNLDKNGGGLGFDVTCKKKKNIGGAEWSYSTSMGFEDNIKVESRIKTHWKILSLKVDELRFSVNDTKTETIGFDTKIHDNMGMIINQVGDTTGDGKKNIGDWAKEGHQLRKIYEDTRTVGESFKSLSEQAKSATNRKLVDVMIGGGMHFVIRAEITVEGSLRFTFSQSNTAGVELVNGKFRPIYDHETTKKADLFIKAEITIRLGFEFQLIGINVVDLGVQAGAGFTANGIVYSYDKSSGALMEVCGVNGALLPPDGSMDAGEMQVSEMAPRMPEDDTRISRLCVEGRIYPILNIFACSDSSVAGKLFGTLEIEILGEDQSIRNVHYEFDENGGGQVSECTATANESYGITTGDALTLNMEDYAIPVNKEEADVGLAIVTLPKNSTIKDVSIKSDNPDVLEVENLLHKETNEKTVKPKLTISQKAVIPGLDADVERDISYQFGSVFYEDMSGGSKPQFALLGVMDGIANVTVSVNGESVTVPVQVGTGNMTIISEGALVSKVGAFTVNSGDSVQLEFEHIPEDKSLSDIKFTSSNPSVAFVSWKGTVKAVGVGDAEITAKLRGEEGVYETVFTIHVVS